MVHISKLCGHSIAQITGLQHQIETRGFVALLAPPRKGLPFKEEGHKLLMLDRVKLLDCVQILAALKNKIVNVPAIAPKALRLFNRHYGHTLHRRGCHLGWWCGWSLLLLCRLRQSSILAFQALDLFGQIEQTPVLFRHTKIKLLCLALLDGGHNIIIEFVRCEIMETRCV